MLGLCAAKGDASPSAYAMLLAAFGVFVEVTGPLLWLTGNALVSSLGAAAVGAMHTYIILANPLAGGGVRPDAPVPVGFPKPTWGVTLVLAPPALLGQWMDEFSKFAPSLK